MIRLEAVTKQYEGSPVLRNVNFHLAKGEFAFLKGRSGSGKSTLLKALYRDVRIDAGEIFVEGTNIATLPKYVLRRHMGIIFQSFELIEQLTVFENIALAGRAIGTAKEAIESRAMHLLGRVGLAHKRDAYPHQLSGGQQQRVAIARALLNKPTILLADEPTGNLDEQTAEEIMELLYELHAEEQVTMLIVTHAEKYLVGRKIWIMEEGQIHEQTTNQVFA